MNIGIITFHCSYNYGSAIQAFALQEYLTSRGHNVEIINFQSRDFSAYSVVKTDSVRSIVSSLLFLKKNLSKKKAFEDFQNDYMNLSPVFKEGDNLALRNYASKYDAVICGGDQIWNIDATMGVVSEFFLSFVDEGKIKASYAPSLAKAKFKDEYYGETQASQVAEYLASFDAISVREESTVSTFQALVSQKIDVVVDPAWLLPADSYRKIKAPHEYENYVFLYCTDKNEDMMERCNSIALKLNLKIIYISKHDCHFDCPSVNVYGCSPRTFISLIDDSDCVVTNSFHATIFSMLFQKKFITYETKSASSRMVDLLTRLGLRDCLASFCKDLLPGEVNWADVQSKQNALIEPSKMYLQKVLTELHN